MFNPVDVHVGRRVRQRRWITGLTQQQLASHLGIKFQQVQKYESGANRISASRLWDIAVGLGVPVSFFYVGLGDQPANSPHDRGELIIDKEGLELVRSYYGIPEAQRRRLFELASALSAAA